MAYLYIVRCNFTRADLEQSWNDWYSGTELLSDAPRRCLAAAEIAGVRGVVAHAIDADAVGFYRRHGFLPSPLGERVMLLPIETVRALFAG